VEVKYVLKERCLDVSLEPNKKMVYGGKAATVNYLILLMNQTFLITLK
jgi:hypothetical protein